MNNFKSVWTSITGSFSSIVPILFACCKSGACIGVCASPLTSLLGISTAGFAASPIFHAIVPILIALSAVSFTISYYSLYVLPKYKNCGTECNCTPDRSSVRKEKISKTIFWVGLLASLAFFIYFEVEEYQKNQKTSQTECCTTSINSCDSTTKLAKIDTTAACCSGEKSCELENE